jgi:hypothetical protein
MDLLLWINEAKKNIEKIYCNISKWNISHPNSLPSIQLAKKNTWGKVNEHQTLWQNWRPAHIMVFRMKQNHWLYLHLMRTQLLFMNSMSLYINFFFWKKREPFFILFFEVDEHEYIKKMPTTFVKIITYYI